MEGLAHRLRADTGIKGDTMPDGTVRRGTATAANNKQQLFIITRVRSLQNQRNLYRPQGVGSAAMVHKHTVHQIPEVRARAAARGPARSVQPGHIEFGTGNWSLWECLDGIMNRQLPTEESVVTFPYRLEELTDLELYGSIPRWYLTTPGF